jgi:hypothetical protein
MRPGVGEKEHCAARYGDFIPLPKGRALAVFDRRQ